MSSGCFLKGVGALAALLIAGVLTFQCAGRSRLDYEMEQLARSGAVMSLSEIRFAGKQLEPDPMPWIEDLRYGELWHRDVVRELESVREILDDLRTGGEPGLLRADEATRDRAIELLEILLACGPDIERLSFELDQKLDLGTPLADLSECELALFELDLLDVEHLHETFLDACLYANFDTTKWIDKQARVLFGSELSKVTYALMSATVLPPKTAPQVAWGGDVDRALRLVEAGFCSMELARGIPNVASHSVWLLQLSSSLAGLRQMLPNLPQSTGLDDIEVRVKQLEPREMLIRALEGERAWGLDVYARLGVRSAGIGEELRFALFQGFDQAEFLRHYREAIENLRSSGQSQSGVVATWDKDGARYWAPIATMMVPNVNSSLKFTLELEAEVAVARVALTAHRAGFEEAAELCARIQDPLGSQPLSIKRTEDGAILIWSVGRDGVDDGGDPTRDAKGVRRDMVWTVR